MCNDPNADERKTGFSFAQIHLQGWFYDFFRLSRNDLETYKTNILITHARTKIPLLSNPLQPDAGNEFNLQPGANRQCHLDRAKR